MSRTTGWLVEPTDDDRAAQYADAADEIEDAVAHLARAVEALEPLEVRGEAERRERFENVAELLDDHWIDLREREREHSSKEISVPDPDVDWKARVAEAERLPDEYEPTPMPDLDLDVGTSTLAFSKTPERKVEDRHGNRARQWLAHIPSARSATKVNYVFVDTGEQTALDDVSAGDIFAIGSKRHDNCRTQAFYRASHDGLECLGVGGEGRRTAADLLQRDQTEGGA